MLLSVQKRGRACAAALTAQVHGVHLEMFERAGASPPRSPTTTRSDPGCTATARSSSRPGGEVHLDLAEVDLLLIDRVGYVGDVGRVEGRTDGDSRSPSGKADPSTRTHQVVAAARPSLTTEPAHSSIARKAGSHRPASGNQAEYRARTRPQPPAPRYPRTQLRRSVAAAKQQRAKNGRSRTSPAGIRGDAPCRMPTRSGTLGELLPRPRIRRSVADGSDRHG